MIGGGARATAALFRDYCAFAGWKLAAALLLMVAGAVAEGAGVLMIVPLVAIAAGTERLPPMLDSISERFAAVAVDQRLLLAISLFIAAMTARAILLYARDVLLAQLLVGHEASMQVRAAATLAQRGWPFASRVGQSGMQSLLLTDIPRASSAVNYGQHMFVCAIMLAVQFALAAWLSPAMALFALIAIAVGYALSWRWIVKGRDSGLAITQHSDHSAAAAFRLHAGLKAALAQGTVPHFLAEYGASLDRLSGQFNRFAGDTAAVRAGAAIASAAAAAGLLIVGDRLLDLPFPVLMALIVLFARMSGPAQQLQQSVQMVAATAPAFAAIEQRIGGLQAVAAPPTAPAEPLHWSELRLDRATYEHAPGLGVRGASLALRHGEWIGIGGDSGAGKTSLIDMIVGLTPPVSGTIEIDGVALGGDLLERWRRVIAYVGQTDAVLDDSVRGNLLAGGGGGDEPSLWKALDTVGLADRVRRFPAGLDESVGDRGSSLSGGERQRLALARAILRQPSLLILDEATSALDRRSEEALLRKLRALDPRPAALLVAHRDSTLAMCDKHFKIGSGAILGHGHANRQKCS